MRRAQPKVESFRHAPFRLCGGFLVPPSLTFPQASRFIPDGRISRVRLATTTCPPTAFPYPMRLKRSLAFPPLGYGLPLVSTKPALAPHTQALSPVRWAVPCPSWPRVPLPSPGFPLPGAASGRLEPALPGRLRSYGLMRQTWMLQGPSLSLGPSVFAGGCEPLLQNRPFPTLSLQSLSRRLDPYPAAISRCSYSFLPGRHRPHVTRDTFGSPDIPCMATSTGGKISGLQSFTHVQAPRLARPPDCSHRFIAERRPDRLHHASLGWLPAPRCGIATCVNRVIPTAGLSPAALQPCRLLPRARARLHLSQPGATIVGILTGTGKGKGSFFANLTSL